ncbi:AI-2E family transporter [Marinisporobacter balticus]|uniref:Putative PurR-regulated permease PerM n=1 Tax=Marinisporobacter balticus TaxID=2018667 RepID=A0A4R2KXK8_9FIRM|nr:AI-2E family transporter [Marinisporobacter balticus]TCO74978.1 putative PurR-regulated permease PerM [Marinisporobacter balticus]
MKEWINKRNLGHYVKTLIVIILSIIFYKFMDNMNGLYASISVKMETIINVIKPFMVAIMIAYILNPIVRWFELELLSRVLKRNGKNKYNRLISTTLIFVIFILIIVLTTALVLPRIAVSIKDLTSALPTFIDENESNIIAWIDDLYTNDVYNIESELQKNINNLFHKGSEIFKAGLTNVLLSIIAATSKTLNILLSLVVSFYILIDKDKLLKSAERLLRALFNDEKVNSFKKFCKEADNTFVKFVIGKSIDSFIVGLIALVGLYLMKSPYPLLIGIMVMVLNMIPYFGPFIGAIIGFVFVAFVSMTKALWVLFFLILLQQFDGLYLGPKILGDKMGVSPLWIIFSIVVGGSLFGVIGMFLGVPAISVILVAVKRFVDKRLAEKNEIKCKK